MYVALIVDGRVVNVREATAGDPIQPCEVEIPAMIPVGTGWLYVAGRFIPYG